MMTKQLLSTKLWEHRLLGAAVLVGVSGAWAVTAATRFFTRESGVPLALGLAVGLCGLAVTLALFLRAAEGDWFHPLAFPTLYMAVVFVAPVLWVLGTEQSLGNIDPSEVTPRLVVVFMLTVGAFGVGALIGTRWRPAKPMNRAVNYLRMRRMGRSLLLVVAVSRLVRLPGLLSVPYGEGQLEYGPGAWLSIVEGGLVFLGVIFVVVANTQLHRTVLRRIDLALVALFALATLASGSRGELLAPVLFAIWAQHSYVKPLRLGHALPMALVAVVVFQVAAAYRTNYALTAPVLPGDRVSFIKGALFPISTPVQLTGTVVQAVPWRHGFEEGRTYLAAVVRQLPGPVSNALLGPPEDTGTFVYRRIVGLSDPNLGYGFALPAEAYLNFGMPGVAATSLLVGALFGFAYRQRIRVPSRALHFLYPVLVATLPLALRSDALLQIKLVLYPMLALALMYRLCSVSTSLERMNRIPSAIPSSIGQDILHQY